MGVYSTYLNNHATDLTNRIYPDKYYAPEWIQLFFIGMCKLNLFGIERRDAANKPTPT